MKTTKQAESVEYRNQAAQRVLSVLAAFVGSEGTVSPRNLEESLGLTKITIRRALETLETSGFVTSMDGGKSYALGYRVLGLSNGRVDDFDIKDICRPFLAALHELTGESVILSIIAGDNRVPMDVIEAKGPRIAHTQKGLSVPLHVGKTSRTLLAFLDDADIEAYIRAAKPINEFGDFFAASRFETVDDIWRDVRKVREDGYIMWAGAEEFGAFYVTFPILDRASRPHAALTIAGPRERFTEKRARELLPELRSVLRPLEDRARLIPASPILITREHL
ncbi:IclR family transcriptional regulator (plasmid) [Paraburkholderia strydomiana]